MDEKEFDSFNTPNQFAYSAIGMDSLDSSEYTIVNVLIDESGSVGGFNTELDNSLLTVLESCLKHPRSEQLLMRVAAFEGQNIREITGFANLSAIDKNSLHVNPCGSTPLYDAVLDGIETTEGYAKTLNDQDYFCNGIMFVITDGMDNNSYRATVAKIKDAVANIRKTEVLESMKMILIGVNDGDTNVQTYLEDFNTEAGFDEHISIDNVDAGSLAKLAQFISQSISSTSQSLGSGGPSTAVNFTI